MQKAVSFRMKIIPAALFRLKTVPSASPAAGMNRRPVPHENRPCRLAGCRDEPPPRLSDS